jgi:ABC-type polysaccharide/polyol phosphate transport system ATPase subunit
VTSRAERTAIEVAGLVKIYPGAGRLRDALRLLLRPARAATAGKLALDGVSFGVEAGSSLGVVGRNGSGKTTLLRVLAGSLRPSQGSVRVDGRVAALLDLGAGIDPEFTGRENALLLGMLAGATRREIDERVGPVREFSGLGAAFDEPVRGYSAGMVLRLAFATAVHADPDVLLVDEVLAVGDAFFQQRCLRRIRELQARGCTSVLVTHDPAAVISFCDQALWLEHGRVACAGDPAKVVREYMGARYRDEAALDESPLEARSAGLAEEVELEPAHGIANVDHRYGDERATIEGIALRDERGGPLAAPAAGELLRVVITIRGRARIDAPIVGFTLRGHLGEIISATNTAYERRELPPLAAGDLLSVEFALHWPPFASGTFSLSPAVADGTLDRHHMNDWIDNALVTEAPNPEVRYGWMKLPDVAVRYALDRGEAR